MTWASATPRRGALGALRLDHVRIDVHPGGPAWQDRLRRGVTDARAIGAGSSWRCRWTRPRMGHLQGIPALLGGIPVTRVLVLHAPTQCDRVDPGTWMARARRALGDALPGARWISGTDGDFAEINRDRPAARWHRCCRWRVLRPQPADPRLGRDVHEPRHSRPRATTVPPPRRGSRRATCVSRR